MHKLYAVPYVLAHAFTRVTIDTKNTNGIVRMLSVALKEDNALAGFVIVGDKKHDLREPNSGHAFFFAESMRVALAAFDSPEPLWSIASASESKG